MNFPPAVLEVIGFQFLKEKVAWTIVARLLIYKHHPPHQQNFKKLSAFFGFSGCQQAHKCAVFPKSQDYEAIWGPQLGA